MEEVERREKRIGSSLEAAPRVYVADPSYREAMKAEAPGGKVDDFLAEISITSQAYLVDGAAPDAAFRSDETADIAVVPGRAEGEKCARSWKYSTEIGADARYPDLSPRDAEAVALWDAEHG